MHFSRHLIGQSLRLLHFGDTPVAYRRRLMTMGLYPGQVVIWRGAAPLGCPMYFQIGRVWLALRKAEISALHWEAV